MDGFLIVNKPSGPTSHDVVAEVRRLAHTRQVGHSGTLDPLAEGVLVLAINRATRALPFLPDTGKTYWAEMELGTETETQDSSGRVTASAQGFEVTRDRLLEAARAFTGEIDQVPPMYSAVKSGGRKLYELARQGRVVERRPRRVTVRCIELLSENGGWGPGDRVAFRVDCSTGTYVRTLCHDMGHWLGCLAHMTRLLRERVGPFTLQDAVAPADLRQRPGLLPGLVIPLNKALAEIPAVAVERHEVLKVTHGNSIATRSNAPGGFARLLAPDGELLAIAEMRHCDEGTFWQPVRVFADQEGATT